MKTYVVMGSRSDMEWFNSCLLSWDLLNAEIVWNFMTDKMSCAGIVVNKHVGPQIHIRTNPLRSPTVCPRSV